MRRRRRRSSGGLAAKRALRRRIATGWATTDSDEIARRIERGAAEPMRIVNLDPGEPFYGTFAVVSEQSGMPYRVEIRSLGERSNGCNCPDFRVNALGTCKHIEAVLQGLRKKPRLFKRAEAAGSPRAEVRLERKGTPRVCVDLPLKTTPALRRFVDRFFDATGALRGRPEDAVPALQRSIEGLRTPVRRRVRLSAEVTGWAEDLKRRAEREASRRAFMEDLREGRRSLEVVRHPLYDYQREGMLHLVFGERTMLADDMGLGKTVQAVAACALLRELRGVQRVLVVSPASLKTEWEEQIEKFTDLPQQTILGPKPKRIKAYRDPSFFCLTNYEQVLRDVREINEILSPDVVILDEAQRIKNWNTKTAQAVKRLQSPYAFVLTGTPLENRIDEIYSITEFLDPHIFGPLFRFNRDFYDLDGRGRPTGYKNLGELRRRIRPVMLRRRKEEVEDQLPERIDNNYFVEMGIEQREIYDGYSQKVAALWHKAKRRPLTKEEHENLQRWLACMRMLCDTAYILDQETKVCPKLSELERVLEDVGVLDGRKALVFSEWERMLQLVRDLAEEMGVGYAWHTGKVPQKRRREEINRFKSDPECRLFLSTDSGGLGLNLQAASVVVNLDLPWNPARLEQRIARAWRKQQRAGVNVVNLVTRDSIEHRMLATLQVKRELADGVVDGRGDLSSLKMPSGREAFLRRLKLIMGEEPPAPRPVKPELKEELPPRDRFRQDVLCEFPGRVQLIAACDLPGNGGEGALVVVDRDADQVEGVLKRLHGQAYGGGQGAVEVLDRNTYDTLQKLSAMGLVRFEAGRELHRGAALRPPGPSEEERRLERANELSAEAERKMKMGRLLAEGGFPQESLPPIHEAVELSIGALMLLTGDGDVGDDQDPVPAPAIHAKLVPAGLLDQDDAARVSSLRELAQAGDVDDATARSLLDAASVITEKTSAALAKEGLGG